MPSTVENTLRLFRAGQYLAILDELEAADRDLSSFQPEYRITIAHTLLQTGDVRRAVEIVDRETSLTTRPGLRAQGEVIKGLAARHQAEVSKALRHYQLAVQFAKQDSDYTQLVWAAAQRFRLLAELRPSNELAAMLAEIRQTAIRAGDPHAVAYMHYAVALMEASNGRTLEARRHLDTSRSLLTTYPNAWLELLNYIAAFFLDFLDGDYRRALDNLDHARSLLQVTGSRERTLIDCNEAHVLLVTGRLRSAAEKFQSVINSDTGLARIGAIEGLARVHLHSGRLIECETTLDAHDRLVAEDEHLSAAFVGRWTAATRVRLLLKKGLFSDAIEAAETSSRQAYVIRDGLLSTELTCLRAEALVARGDVSIAAHSLVRLDTATNGDPIGQPATYYAARAHVSRSQDPILSFEMFRRALRIWDEEGNQCASNENRHFANRTSASRASDEPQLLRLLGNVSAALMLGHNPRLLGQELSDAIALLDCSPSVRLMESTQPTDTRHSETQCRIEVGADDGKAWSLVCEIPPDPLKSLALADIARLAGGALAVRERLDEAKRRAALWPESPVEDQAGAIFAGDEMQTLLAMAQRVGSTNVPILITGETGTGKEVLARTIHGYSNRAKGPFIPFNCTSTPKDMLDSQLFGHRRGSFTGATENFLGIIRGATGGTLFLDEIGDMPLDVQPKLLRFLESNEVHPVGETRPVRVDVRVIAATNADLDALVADSRFREDLFYRLDIVRLHLPPLRERRTEIPALVQHYLQKYAQEYGKRDLRLAEETMEYLLLYRWPGNIRQLANEMRRLTALCETGAVVMPEHLHHDIAASRRTLPASERVLDPHEVVVRLDQPMAAATEHLERAMLQWGLQQCGGRIEETAALLGISRKGLYLKRQRFGIDPPEPVHASASN